MPMGLSKSKLLKYVVIAVISVLIASMWPRGEKKEESFHRDYEEIMKSGVLRVVTEYNSISYFVDGDSISGFYYELIRAFAQEKGLKAEITPEMSFEKRMQGLANGTYDLIAYGMPVTNELSDSILLTVPIIKTKQILVQRSYETDSLTYISSQLQLANKTVHIEKGSPSIPRIHNLGNEIADTIYIDEIEKYGSEQLIAMVAHGDIDYAIIDENIARANIDSFPQLDIHTGISFTRFYAWGMRKESVDLQEELNKWLTEYMKTKAFQKIYSKYF